MDTATTKLRAQAKHANAPAQFPKRELCWGVFAGSCRRVLWAKGKTELVTTGEGFPIREQLPSAVRERLEKGGRVADTPATRLGAGGGFEAGTPLRFPPPVMPAPAEGETDERD